MAQIQLSRVNLSSGGVLSLQWMKGGRKKGELAASLRMLLRGEDPLYGRITLCLTHSYSKYHLDINCQIWEIEFKL
jgi:hypothetical protein